MARAIKQGQHIFIAFQNGEAVLDSQLRPRMYKSVEQFKKSFPGWRQGEAELVEYAPTLTQPNEPLTQADLDVMDYDKVWIDYEDGTGEWALVCNGYIYSIDTLEGAGFDFTDYMRGEKLEPHGYKVYHRPPEGEEDT